MRSYRRSSEPRRTSSPILDPRAIHAAIAAGAAAGGGRVVVPTGSFVTGPIVLKSKVNLHLADGATLAFTRNPTVYLPLVLTCWEGVEVLNYSPFIYAFDQTDIAITGSGTLDGQASDTYWWPWRTIGCSVRAASCGPTLFSRIAARTS